MRRPANHGVALALLGALAAGAAGNEGPPTPPLPGPSLAGMEPAVAGQLAGERQAVAALAADPDTPPAVLAAAFGALGRLYLLHELTQAATLSFDNARRLAPDDFRWPYYLGFVAQRRGDLEAAAEAFAAALALRPEDAAARLRLGQVELARGRFDEAAAALMAAVRQDGTRAAARFELGRLAQARGRPDEAVEHLRAALELAPGASKVHHPLALAYRQLGDLEKAREHLALAGDVAVGFTDPLVDVLADLGSGASLHLVNAGKALAAGRTAEALAEYRLAAEKDPDHPLALRGLGEALAASGDLEGAAAAYRRSIELAPGDAVARYDLGTVLLAAGRLEEAAAELTAAIGLAPDLAPAHANLAAVLGRGGRYAEALAALERALALDPGNREARRQKGVALTALGRPAEAAAELAPLAADDPADAVTRLHLANALAASGDREEAGRRYREVLATANERPALAARAEVGLAALAAGGEAVAHLRRAVERVPGFGEAHRRLATALLAEGGCTAGLPAAEEGFRLLPQDGELAHLVARLLAACPEDGLRDGARALALAQSVFAALPRPEHAETLAMAYAELGRFADAIAWQQRALAGLGETGAGEAELTAGRGRLEAYRRGEPWRLPRGERKALP